jgi:hypothetical protein
MAWEIVRKAGRLFVDSHLQDGPAMRKGNEFPQRAAKSFVKACAGYSDKVGARRILPWD